MVRRRYSRWVLWGACFLLTVANVINIGADLGGIADAMHMMTGISALWWTPAFAGFLVAMLLWTSYRVIARTFKWLTAVLFAYSDDHRISGTKVARRTCVQSGFARKAVIT